MGIIETQGLPASGSPRSTLIMALLAAFIIPIGALVVGEGLAALAPERRSSVDFRERYWREVKGYLGAGSSSGERLLSASTGQCGQESNGQPNGAKGTVRAYLTTNPNAAQMSINQLVSILKAQGARAGRATIAEVA